MYKVLLVDDEEEVRQAIARKLDWATLGFEVVGEAANGQEALELSEQLQPDVVMTDIKMPFMDGLTLCRLLKQAQPGVKVAIFSGFDEFEYAKEAIKLEVEEYILKPIDSAELASIFGRLRQALDLEIAEKRDVQRLRQYYEQSLPLMRQQLLTRLLEGHFDQDRLAAQLGDYEMDLSAPLYGVALVRIAEEDETARKMEPRLLGVSLEKTVTELLSGTVSFRLVALPEHLALLFLLDEKDEHKRISAPLAMLIPAVKKLLGLTLTIGIGKTCRRLEDISQSYSEARSALEYRFLMEPGQCIYIGDIEPGSDRFTGLDAQHIDEIIRLIKVGSESELAQAIRAMVREFKSSHLTMQDFQVFILEMSAELLRLIHAYALQDVQAELVSGLLGRSADQFDNLDEMGRWLTELCESLRQLVRRERKDSTRLLIEKARSYAAEHFADSELSVESISGALNISPAYFSTLFKKETGLRFISYLTKLRMEKALEYLGASDDKTYLIAEKVGYADPNYFSYVFKKQYGFSPSKFRTERLHADTPNSALSQQDEQQ